MPRLRAMADRRAMSLMGCFAFLIGLRWMGTAKRLDPASMARIWIRRLVSCGTSGHTGRHGLVRSNAPHRPGGRGVGAGTIGLAVQVGASHVLAEARDGP